MKRLVRRVLFVELTKTVDARRARESRFVWLQEGDDGTNAVFRLRVLGVLNAVLRPLGLTLHVDHWGQGLDY